MNDDLNLILLAGVSKWNVLTFCNGDRMTTTESHKSNAVIYSTGDKPGTILPEAGIPRNTLSTAALSRMDSLTFSDSGGPSGSCVQMCCGWKNDFRYDFGIVCWWMWNVNVLSSPTQHARCPVSTIHFLRCWTLLQEQWVCVRCCKLCSKSKRFRNSKKLSSISSHFQFDFHVQAYLLKHWSMLPRRKIERSMP